MTRVCVLYTGGTIGMARSPEGFAPLKGYLAQQMAALGEFASPALPLYDIVEFDPLLDSANMSTADWLKIAHAVVQYDPGYDGFVVIHGTDTMAYTASALAFLLAGLRKPVIITGSQIPLCEVRSDGVENLITALLIAGAYPLPEVCLYFGGKLLRGCRAVKVSASGFGAFDSPDYPPLGSAGIDLLLNWNAIAPPPPPEEPLFVENQFSPLVGVLKVYPGMTAWATRAMLQPPLRGAVLEMYGVGSAPENDRELVAALRQAHEAGIVPVGVTQCRQGTVKLGSYQSGTRLAQAGVSGGLDMTTEAALTKLFYLFGKGLQAEQVREHIPVSLRGELTPARPGWQR